MILVGEFILALFVNRRDLLSPGVIFTSVFSLAALDLVLMQNYWVVNLSSTTAYIVIFGTGSFLVTSFLVRIIPKAGLNKPDTQKDARIVLGSGATMVFCGLYGITILSSLLTVRDISIIIGGEGGLGSLIGYYNNYSKQSDLDVSLPVWLSIPYSICTMAGYVWAFIIADYRSRQQRIPAGAPLLFILAVITSLSTGSRGDMISLILCLFVMLIVATRSHAATTGKKFSYIKLIIAIAAVGVTFQTLGTRLGRDSDQFNFVEYLSIYTGAPLLNLDAWVRLDWPAGQVWGSETLRVLWNGLGQLFGVPQWEYLTDRAFMTSNGHATGNVGTTFFDYYHDFGLIGVIVMSALMGLTMQLGYERFGRRWRSESPIGQIVYVFALFLTARSFFANSVISTMVSLGFLKTLAIWILLVLLFRQSDTLENHIRTNQLQFSRHDRSNSFSSDSIKILMR